MLGHATRELRARELRAAYAAWKKLGEIEGERAQFAVLEELLRSRRDELVRAYPNVVEVTLGYGTYRARKPKREQKLSERRAARRKVDEALGVTFLVRRKVQDVRKLKPAHVIPKHLLTYATIEGERTLCAVATDVAPLDERRAIAHAGRPFVFVTRANSSHPHTKGAVACAVSIPGLRESRPFLLSCLHVFGMCSHDLKSDRTTNGPPDGRWVRQRSESGALIGPVSEYYGALRRTIDPKASFDAALALGVQTALANTVVTSRPRTLAAGYWNIPKTLVVRTPRGPVRVEKTDKICVFDILYENIGEYPNGPLVLVNVSARGGELVPGDSGSAVTDESGELLCGMHIAGTPDGRTGYMIPAYEALRLTNFKGLGSIGGREHLEFWTPA